MTTFVSEATTWEFTVKVPVLLPVGMMMDGAETLAAAGFELLRLTTTGLEALPLRVTVATGSGRTPPTTEDGLRDSVTVIPWTVKVAFFVTGPRVAEITTGVVFGVVSVVIWN